MSSSRNYTVPDPPGLFDGHVWPMYVKHKKIMEDLKVNVGKLFGAHINGIYYAVILVMKCVIKAVELLILLSLQQWGKLMDLQN